jgi:hypothetical protein
MTEQAQIVEVVPSRRSWWWPTYWWALLTLVPLGKTFAPPRVVLSKRVELRRQERYNFDGQVGQTNGV